MAVRILSPPLFPSERSKNISRWYIQHRIVEQSIKTSFDSMGIHSSMQDLVASLSGLTGTAGFVLNESTGYAGA